MSQEINKHVARAIVELAIFLEFSGDDALNPDAQCRGLND